MAKLVNVKTSEEHALTGEVVLIGRLPGSGIQVQEKQVSRRHCRLQRTREGWILFDSGSTSGTYLNGELLSRPHRLQQGDHVRVGTAVFTFHEHGPPPLGDVKLQPLSKASPSQFVPRELTDLPARGLVPVLLGGLLVVLAVGALVAVVILTRPTPARAVRRAAALLCDHKARELWELLSAERKRSLTFEEFRDGVNAVPDGALSVLRTIEVGAARRGESGMVVSVAVVVDGKRLADEVVLHREGGDWKVHSVPAGRLAELTPPPPEEPPPSEDDDEP